MTPLATPVPTAAPMPTPAAVPGSGPFLVADSLRIGLIRDGAELRIVDSADFTLDAGASLGIVGESGSGKTMLCRSFIGEPHSSHMTFSRSVASTASSSGSGMFSVKVQLG